MGERGWRLAGIRVDHDGSETLVRNYVDLAQIRPAFESAMKSTLAFITIFSLFAFGIVSADEVAVEPTGIYKTIEVRFAYDTIRALHDKNDDKRLAVISAIRNRPEDFSPPVFYVLSSVLFEQDKKDEAVFWFYAGQLRGRIDANICADKSARSAVGALNQKFGAPINQYSFRNMSLLTNTVERVLAWEEKTPCRYDRRWINLHGMAAMTGDTNAPLSAPKEQWEIIRKQTREEYRSEFHAALAKFNSLKH
jgi:hypothetical protein